MAGSGFSADAWISADGAFVAFSSSAANLIAGQVDAASTAIFSSTPTQRGQ